MLTALTTARQNFDALKGGCRTDRMDRDAKTHAMRKRLSGLVSELKQAIAPLDPRWLDFGLNMPGAASVPVAPENVEALPTLPGQIQVSSDASVNATGYRFYYQRPILDPEPLHAGSSTTPLFIITGLTAGQEYLLYVSATNAGGESELSEPATAVVSVRRRLDRQQKLATERGVSPRSAALSCGSLALVAQCRRQGGLVALDSNSFTAPRDYRRWLANQGNYTWKAGERPLQALQQDIDFKLAHRTVQQLICYGCERPGQLWVLDDCAFAPDGTQILPDQDGVFWHDGKGFKLLRDAHGVPLGEEKQTFKMAGACMRPDEGLILDSAGKLRLQKEQSDQPEALRELLGGLVTGLNESYGGHDGSLLVGSAQAFFAAPELFQTVGQFPGIWITGEKGSGKTCTAKWLMALHGFADIETGISFKSSTAVGMQIAMGQCANIPVWGDEYKETELRDANIKGVIHSGFNREQPSKWSADGASRTIRTNLIITGETTCANVATMSRFVSMTAAREKRTGNSEQCAQRLEWLRQHRSLFFAIGRAVLRQRGRFANRLMEILAEWEHFPELAEIDPRTRFTHGVSYASLLAVNEIIPIFNATRCADFRQWMINKALESDRAIAARVDINQFWADLLSALKAGVFGKTRTELERYFKSGPKKNAAPRLTPQQLRDAGEHPHLQWKTRILNFTPGPVIDVVRRYKYSQGQPFVLDQHDLHTLLKTRPYFVPPPPKGHQKKFGKGARTNSYCWAIDLDLFPELGLNLVTDVEWEQSKHHDEDTSAGLLPADQWVDPRKGELFIIIDQLEKPDE